MPAETHVKGLTIDQFWATIEEAWSTINDDGLR
jgi:hypothetical protein